MRCRPLPLVVCLAFPLLVVGMSVTWDDDELWNDNIGSLEVPRAPSAEILNSTLDSASSTGHLDLDYGDLSSKLLTDELLRAVDRDEPPGIGASIRNVTVKGYGSLANWTALSVGIGQLSNLEQLHWLNADPIPGTILATLAEQPQCKLYYAMPFNNWDPYDETVGPIQPVGSEPHREIRAVARSKILNSTNLYALTAHIEYGGDPDPASLKLIHDVLTTCSNLRELDLSISHAGCVVANAQPYAFDFSNSSGQFAPLEVLRLRNYRFDNPYNGERPHRPRYPKLDDLKWPWYHIPETIWHFLWDIYPPIQTSIRKQWEPPVGCNTSEAQCVPDFNKTTNLDGWLERMDFSKLHILDLDAVSSTTLLKLQDARVLSNLASLNIHYANSCAARFLPDFLLSLERPLEKLFLRNIEFDNFDPFVRGIVSGRNSSLTSLSVTENEELRQTRRLTPDHCNGNSLLCQAYGQRSWYDPHLYLTPPQLGELSQSIHNIENLTIDIDRNASSLNSTLDAVATFPNLAALTLHFESPSMQRTRRGIRDPYSWADEALYDPLLNQSSVLQMFRRIRAAQAKHANSSTTADLLDGEYTVIGKDLPATRPNLNEMTVFIGKWHSRHQSRGMSRPQEYIVGRFQCSLNASNPQLASSEEQEICTGGITFPDSPFSTSTFIHDSSSHFLTTDPLNADAHPLVLDADGLWDPSSESPVLTMRRVLQHLHTQIESVDLSLRLKEEDGGYLREARVEGLKEVRSILLEEIREAEARLEVEMRERVDGKRGGGSTSGETSMK